MKINDLEISSFAPVVIPTLCRDTHLKVLLESLSKCRYADQTEVYVSIDYPAKPEHEPGHTRICKFLDKVGNMGFKKLHVIKREKNLGLDSNGNASTTIKTVLEHHDRFIFSEDDNIFAPSFLEFINYNLEKYKDSDEILAVNGYLYPINILTNKNLVFKLEHFSAWGFGIWKEKIKFLNEFSSSNLKRKEIINNSDFKNYCMKYRPNLYSDMVGMTKGNPIWGDALYSAVQIRYHKKSIFPSFSLVRNIGWDGTGTHGGTNTFLLNQKINDTNEKVVYEEANEAINQEYNEAAYDYFRKSIPIIQRILTSITIKLYSLTGIYYNFDGFRSFWKKYFRR